MMYHPGSGTKWNALDAAVGNDVAIVKGDSIRKVLNRLDQLIGKLQSEEPDGGVEMLSGDAKPEETGTTEPQRKSEENDASTPAIDKSRTVMVVHGRDEQLNKSIFAFLRSLDLHPVEWLEAVTATGKAAPYVGEVLDTAFSMAQAVVVLFSGDDMAYLREELRGQQEEPHEVNPTPQARPNVLFEAGMALASHPDETILVEIGKLRPFSDIAGRHTVRLDNTVAKRQDVATRLKTAGCAVKMVGSDWHGAGEFTASEIDEAVVETVSANNSEAEELSEDDKTVLTFLASVGDTGFTAQLVSARLQSSLERAKFLLEALLKLEFVARALYMGKSSTWHLTQRGRQVLNDRGLL